MTQTTKRLAPFVLAVLCFLLPFLRISCRHDRDIRPVSVTGIQLVTGTEIRQKGLFGQVEKYKVPSQPWVIGALVCAVAAGLLCLLKKAADGLSPAFVSAGGLVCMLVAKQHIEAKVLKEGEDVLTVEYGPGFIGVGILLLVGAAIHVYQYQASRGRILQATTPGTAGAVAMAGAGGPEEDMAGARGEATRQAGRQQSDSGVIAPDTSGSPPQKGPDPIAVAVKNIKAATKDAWDALRLFAFDPVGRLPQAFEGLGQVRALRVGVAFGLIFALCLGLAAQRLLSALDILTSALDMHPGKTRSMGIIKSTLFCLIPFFACWAGLSVTRVVLKGVGGWGHDAFIAGASLLPLGFVALIGSVLGVANLEFISVLFLGAICVSILMLFAGLTRICKISDRAATLGVPFILIVTAWLSKVMLAASL
jgi:hypothetical protein